MRTLVELFMPAGRVREWAARVLEELETDGASWPEGAGDEASLRWGYTAGPGLPRAWPLDTGRWILSSEQVYGRLRLPPGFAPAGFIPALADPETAAGVVRTVTRGFDVFPAGSRPASRGGASWNGETDALSPQERRVLDELARGEPNKRIAQLLGLSESTVRFHVGNILAKLGAQNRAEAVYRAMGRGLLVI